VIGPTSTPGTFVTVYNGHASDYPIPKGHGFSLGVRNGHQVIAYETETGLVLGVFDGTVFQAAAVPGTDRFDRDPLLMLDADNHAHVVWTHDTVARSCGASKPTSVGGSTSQDGTYYATDATGSWTPTSDRRFSTSLGPTSFTLDPATHQVSVLIGGNTLRYWTSAQGAAWSATTLTTADVTATSIRVAGQAVFASWVRADGQVFTEMRR
jgi:hypothetical protein